MKAIFAALIFCLLFAVPVFSQEAQKFDEYGSLNCEDYLARMDNAIQQARQNPSLTVFVLIYEGREQKYNSRTKKIESAFPAFGAAEAKIRSIKKYLSIRKLPIKRFSFVKAGFRDEERVEIWLAPPGAAPPNPAPTLRKMKYRKGKAYGFCTGCCL